MNKKYSITDLLAYEEKNKVWDMKFLDYPLWIYCREGMSNQVITISSKFYRPTVKNVMKSTYRTLKFLLTQKAYKKVYFLMDRVEIVEIYKRDQETKKILFLHHENKNTSSDIDYISADFFNILRYILRKTVYLFAPLVYRKFNQKLSFIGYDESRFSKIKIAMGDAVFLKILSWILRHNIPKIYAGTIIPPGEKFLNKLNSYEVQHGVIHDQHVGYIGIPKVSNTLILYDERYLKLLKRNNYKGNLEINSFKMDFLNRFTERSFFAVVYTQPVEKMQKAIEIFFQSYQPENIMIQKHPRDHYIYDLDESYFVEATTPNEVDYPICYTSTIIENFTLLGKDCFIYDIKDMDIVLDNILSIYQEGNKAQLMRYKSLEEIYEQLKLLKQVSTRS